MIIQKYILKEIIPPFLITSFVFIMIFLLSRILEIMKMIVQYQVSGFSIITLLLCTVPTFMIFVLPMSVMLGVLLGFLRLSGDNEITAFKASGINIITKCGPPVLVFAVVCCIMTFIMSIYAAPLGHRLSKTILFDIITTNVNIGLKERTFNDSFKGVTIFANQIDPKTYSLQDVFIHDRLTNKMANTIVAKKGEFISDPKNFSFRMHLYDGVIDQVDYKERRIHKISFESYQFSLNSEQFLSDNKNKAKDRREMSLHELRSSLNGSPQNDSEFKTRQMDYYKKFSIPFACVVMAILAMPLGIKALTRKRSYGIIIGLGCFLGYYLILSACTILAESGMISPFVGMWIPDIVIGLAALFLILKAMKE